MERIIEVDAYHLCHISFFPPRFFFFHSSSFYFFLSLSHFLSRPFRHVNLFTLMLDKRATACSEIAPSRHFTLPLRFRTRVWECQLVQLLRDRSAKIAKVEARISRRLYVHIKRQAGNREKSASQIYGWRLSNRTRRVSPRRYTSVITCRLASIPESIDTYTYTLHPCFPRV